MIVESLRNAHFIEKAHPLFKPAFDWLRKNASNTLPDGRIEIDGDRLIAIPQHPHSHAEADELYESHRKYIDIQYVISGEENIIVGDAGEMAPVSPFDIGKDIVFMHKGGTTCRIPVKPGSFMIIWPHEAHQPCVCRKTPGVVHKVIIKVKAEF